MPMQTSAHEAGFTLMEMLLVLVILGLAANLILTRFHPAPPATILSDAAARVIVARASATIAVTGVRVDAQPWQGGPVEFNADGQARMTSLQSSGRGLWVLPTGGLRLAQ